MSGEEAKSVAWKILPWALDALVGVCLFIQLGMINDIRLLRQDMNEIREWRAGTISNRWTSSDQNNYANEQAKEMTRIWSKISDMQQQWLKDLGDIKVNMAEMRSEMRHAHKELIRP
jgi:hypothetical protein